jgi:aminopeptidase N
VRLLTTCCALFVASAVTNGVACGAAAAPAQQRPVPPAAADSTPLPGEPAAHPPGRVPAPGPYLPGFDALHYRIAIDVPATGVRIASEATIRALVRAPRRDTLRLDLTGLRASAVRVARAAGTPAAVPFRQQDGRLFVAIPPAVRTGDTISVIVAYDGTPDDGLIIRDNVHRRRGAFGDNWPDRGRFWFPAIDHPSDKATVEFAVRVPAGWQVVANGVRIDAQGREQRGGFTADAAPPADGVWRWRMTQPVPTYLMVIGATQFYVRAVDDCARGGVTPRRADGCVPTGFWSFPEDSANAARIFRRAGEMLTYYSALIAPFPYDRLAHVQSATRFGGMENAGAIFYSDRAITGGSLGEGTVAHEIAHQWFGDAVTPARWADVWLSEGFATYFGALFFEAADGAQRFRALREQSWRGYLESDVANLAIVDTLRVPNNDLLELLNANSYNKGGAVLHMLRGVLGDSVFFRGIRRYYQRHLHGNATTTDLQRALEEEAGRPLDWFFEQWLYRPGHPVLRVTHRWIDATREAVVIVEQVHNPDWPAFRLPLQLAFDVGGNVVTRAVELQNRRWEQRFPLPAAPTAVRLDPDGWVLKVLQQ